MARCRFARSSPPAVSPRLGVALAALALSACADAQDSAPPASGADTSEAVVVADGRDRDARSDQDPASWASQPGVEAAIRAARTHWSAVEPGYEEEVRVLAVADGAFTASEADEHAVLYLMGLWPRCCPKMGVAIIEAGSGDGRLIWNVAFETVAQGLHAVPDLDGDGLDELVLRGEFGMGGDVSESMTLVAFGPDGLVRRGGAPLYESGCAAGREGETAYRVLAAPGPAPSLTAEPFTRSCEGGPWASSGPPEPLALDGADGEGYVDLAIE